MLLSTVQKTAKIRGLVNEFADHEQFTQATEWGLSLSICKMGSQLYLIKPKRPRPCKNSLK